MSSKVELEILEHADGLTVVMPPGGNRWIIWLGFGLGIPWVLLIVVAPFVAWFMAPEASRQWALFGVCATILLLIAVDVLAVAGVWFAFYNLGGSETLEIRGEKVAIRRRAMGFTLPVKLRPSPVSTVSVLDPSLAPGNWPHPRLEIRVGRSAVRFGAGLSEQEVGVVYAAIEAALPEQ